MAWCRAEYVGIGFRKGVCGMSEQEWAARLAEGRERVLRLRDRLAAGESESDAARAEGFVTCGGLERVMSGRAAAVLRRSV